MSWKKINASDEAVRSFQARFHHAGKSFRYEKKVFIFLIFFINKILHGRISGLRNSLPIHLHGSVMQSNR